MDVVIRSYNVSSQQYSSNPIYEVELNIFKDTFIDNDLGPEEMLERFYTDKFFKKIGLSIDKFEKKYPELFL